MNRHPDLLPTISVLIAAAMWGLFWLPIRGVEEAGVDAVWSGLLSFACGVVVLLPLVIWRWRQLVGSYRDYMWASFFAGMAFALYTISINMTDVVRVILLFYLTPLWSTLLGIIFLRERLTLNRLVALILAGAGMLTVLGVGVKIPLPSNLGDWLALISGMVWSVASVKLFQAGSQNIVEKSFLFVLFALLFCVLLVVLPFGVESTVPKFSMVEQSIGWVLVISIMMLPLTFMTIWPCTRLSPARVGMLYMMDIIVGVASAAWLLDETFGTRELLGTVLIVVAGVVEVMRPVTRQA